MLRVPLSIKLVTIHYCLKAISVLTHPPFRHVVLGFLITGPVAAFTNICFFLLWFYLSFGLGRLWEMARRMAIGYECYSLLDLFFYRFSPSFQFLITERASRSRLDYSTVMLIGHIGLFIYGVLTCLIIWFLVKRKSAFVKPVQSA